MLGPATPPRVVGEWWVVCITLTGPTEGKVGGDIIYIIYIYHAYLDWDYWKLITGNW